MGATAFPTRFGLVSTCTESPTSTERREATSFWSQADASVEEVVNDAKGEGLGLQTKLLKV